MFRKLKAEEIEVRVGTVKDTGISLLLYKDARVDQNILDETVGEFGWQRLHAAIKNVIYCGVSIFDKETNQWIEKWDAGTESNTEKEKGEASDSFKRACFNWGIGRELYTSPFIWVGKDNLKDKYDKFSVKAIDYDANGNINKLSIYSETLKKVVYNFGRQVEQPKTKEVVKEDNKQELIDKLLSFNIDVNAFLVYAGAKSLEDVSVEKLKDTIRRKENQSGVAKN